MFLLCDRPAGAGLMKLEGRAGIERSPGMLVARQNRAKKDEDALCSFAERGGIFPDIAIPRAASLPALLDNGGAGRPHGNHLPIVC